MALTNFEVTGTFKAVITDGPDASSDPDVQNISGSVVFTPSIPEAAVDGVLYRLQPIRARIEEDGILKAIDSTIGVGLPCGDDTEGQPLHGLTYKVEFTNVVYDRQSNQRIEPFRFTAPTTATTIDIATVERIPL